MTARSTVHVDTSPTAGITIHRIPLRRPHRSGCVENEVRAILSAYLGAEPDIVIGDHGKPALRGGELAFNLAHSDALALLAISTMGPLGVDIERIVSSRDHTGLARRYFTADEADAIAHAPGAFYRLWTRKEAWVKAQGGGLAIPLDTIDLQGDVTGWFIADLDAGPGYAAAVARPGAPARVLFDSI